MCTLALAMDSNLSIYLVKIRTYLKIRNAIPHLLADRHVAWSVLVYITKKHGRLGVMIAKPGNRH